MMCLPLLLRRLKRSLLKTQLIFSYHDFQGMPLDLFSLLESMQRPFLAHYKIAGKAHSTIDLLRMLCFLKKASASHRITGIAMGEYGLPSRVFRPSLWK